MNEVIYLNAAPEDLRDVRRLFREYAAGLTFDLAYQNFEGELESLPAPYHPPGGALLVAKQGTSIVGVVGLKTLSDTVAEIKRTYVVPSARNKGIAAELLRQALEKAKELGFRSVRLDSHRPSMAPAIALYQKLGFYEIPPYGPDLNGAVAFFELSLDQLPKS